jgi:Immunity protein 40
MKKSNFFWSEKIDAVLVNGLSLEEYGIANYALSRTNALIAIDKLRNMGVTILGGDVYLREGINWKSTGDSWCIEIQDGNISDQSVNFGYEKALEYINNHRIEDIYFSIVPSI